MKKIKGEKIIKFLIILVISCIVYSPLLVGHYSTDTYNIANRGYKEYAINYSLNDGRPAMCLISLLANAIHLPIMPYIIILTFIALIISSMSVLKLQELILKYSNLKGKKTEYIILALAYIIIFNFSYLENLQFAECAVMAVSIYLNILVTQTIIDKNKNYLIKGPILAIISVLFYQGTINWLFTVTFFLSILKEKKLNWQVIRNLILSGIFGGLGCLVDLIQIRITGKIFGLTQVRMGSFSNIQDNFVYISKNIGEVLKNTYYLFPENGLYIYLTILLLYTLFFINQKKEKNSIQLNILLIILVCIVSVFSLHLLTLSAFGTGRMSFSIGAMIGLILLYLYCNMGEVKTKKEIASKIILYIITISYIAVSVTSITTTIYEHKKVNEYDKQECETIAKWIEEYEEENNVEVKNIVFFYTKSSKAFYMNLHKRNSLCYKALSADWSRIGAINYYSNRHFIEKKSTDNREKVNYYLKQVYNKSWEKLDKGQLFFDGNTLYYYLY